jgi:hypothetical protein
MTEQALPNYSSSTGTRLLSAGAVMGLLVAGVFVLGRVADDATLAMALTAAWFGAVFVAGAVLTRRRPDLRLPMALGFAVVAVAIGVLIGLPTLRGKEVNERVVTAQPAVPTAPGRGATKQSATNVQLASGRFGSIAHPGRGQATAIQLAGGGRVLTLTNFGTDSGPDLRLYLSTADPAKGSLGKFRDLGALKGNSGNQQYRVPAGIDLERYSTVVVWCRAFSVPFTSAPLNRT